MCDQPHPQPNEGQKFGGGQLLRTPRHRMTKFCSNQRRGGKISYEVDIPTSPAPGARYQGPNIVFRLLHNSLSARMRQSSSKFDKALQAATGGNISTGRLPPTPIVEQ